MRLLRAHGERPRYHHRMVGTTARLDALQAAVLRRKLTRLEGWNDERRRLGASCARGWQPVAALANARAVDPVHAPFADGDHVYHLFVVRCAARDALREHLAERGRRLARSTTRRRSTAPRPTPTSASARQPAGERGAGRADLLAAAVPGHEPRPSSSGRERGGGIHERRNRTRALI